MSKLVAVYGSLRKGLGNHRCLGDSRQVGTTRIKGWEMFSLGGFPGIRTGHGEIVIEVYEVTDVGTEAALDRLEGYRGPDRNNFYDKTHVDTEFGTAEIYTLEHGYEDHGVVEGGDWSAYRNRFRG